MADGLPRLWIARASAPLPPEADEWRSAEEDARLRRCRDPGERRRRTVAWSLRRWALSQSRPGVAPADWRFVAGPTGKPALAPPFLTYGLQHNLSHGGDYAAVLIAGAPCGVDVEPPPAGLEAASVVFAAAEQAEIAAHARPAERFLQHWVAKEAVLKLRGTGFDRGAERLRLTLAPDGRSAVPRPLPDDEPGPPPDLAVRLWPLPDGHWVAAALCGPMPDRGPEWVTWRTD